MPKSKQTKVKDKLKDEDGDKNKDDESDQGIEEDNDDKIVEINHLLYKGIKDAFDLELKKIFRNVARKYGDEYFFNQEDLINFYNQFNIEFMYKSSQNVEHVPEKPSKTPNVSEERCLARVWAGGHMIRDGKTEQYGDQCQRKKIADKLFCKQHLEHLVHGRFDEEPSKIVKGFFIKHNDKSYNVL
jgi:hypothetical protein